MGALNPIGAVLNIGSTLIERLIPDKGAQAQAKAQLVQMQVAGELAQITGQLDIDKTEAANTSVFVAGWRPGIGWVCCAGLASQFLVRPFAMWFAALAHRPDLVYPSLDLSTLMTLVFAMLGIGVHEKLTNGS